jgi:sucrose-6-phosphate hydrolase SacC (GH32 family)
VPQATGRCDSGYRYYAPQSLTLADGRRVAIGWLRENLDELAEGDQSWVGAMSLPRELSLDDSGSLRSRPVRELDSARRELLVSRLVEGRGAIELNLSARAAHAVELSVTPVRGEAVMVRLRLAGPGLEDIEVLVTADGAQIREGGRALTVVARAAGDAGPRAGRVGQVSAFYDGGILEVYSPHAAPATAISSRHGAYDLLDIEISARHGEAPCAASVTVWSAGRPVLG